MKNKGKMILEIHIDIFQDRIRSFASENGKVTMIPFGGTVTGEIMTGIVEPFGVDTQITNQADVRHMSARYMLTGQDRSGNPCHIYVENNAWFTNGESPKPFTTVPTFHTDSPELAAYLSKDCFIGEGKHDANGLVITFYETAE